WDRWRRVRPRAWRRSSSEADGQTPRGHRPGGRWPRERTSSRRCPAPGPVTTPPGTTAGWYNQNSCRRMWDAASDVSRALARNSLGRVLCGSRLGLDKLVQWWRATTTGSTSMRVDGLPAVDAKQGSTVALAPEEIAGAVGRVAHGFTLQMPRGRHGARGTGAEDVDEALRPWALELPQAAVRAQEHARPARMHARRRHEGVESRRRRQRGDVDGTRGP